MFKISRRLIESNHPFLDDILSVGTYQKIGASLSSNKVLIFINNIIDCKLILLFLSYDHNLLISHFLEIVIGLACMNHFHKLLLTIEREKPIYLLYWNSIRFSTINDLDAISQAFQPLQEIIIHPLHYDALKIDLVYVHERIVIAPLP